MRLGVLLLSNFVRQNAVASASAKTAGAFFVFAVFFAIVYLPVLTGHYAFVDDYSALFLGLTGKFGSEAALMIEGGRPVFAVLNSYAFHFAKSVGDLGWSRGLSVAGIAAVATAAYRFLQGKSLPPSLSLAVAALVGLMPAFQVYAAWAFTAFCPWAALLAILAFMLLDSETGALKNSSLMLSFLLLVVSLAIYQSAAMMFWFCAGASWLAAPRLPRFSKIARSVLVMAGALIVDLGLCRILPLLLYGSVTPLARTTLVSDLAGKTAWFVRGPLVDAFNLPLVIPHNAVALALASFILAGLWLSAAGGWETRVSRIVLAVALLPLSYFPSLIVSMNGPAHRTQVAMASLVLVYAAIALLGWLRWMRAERMLPIFGGIAVVVCAAMAARNVLIEFVQPQAKEYRLVANDLIKNSRTFEGKRLYLVSARSQDKLAPYIRYDEYGKPSSNDIWAAHAMAWLILHDAKSPAADRFAGATLGGPGPVPQGDTIVDFGRILHPP